MRRGEASPRVRQQAIDLHEAGIPYTDISEYLGYSVESIFRWVKSWKEGYPRGPKDHTDDNEAFVFEFIEANKLQPLDDDE